MSIRNPDYRGYRFPSEIISYAVWLYHRFCLSFRDVEELLAERGVTVIEFRKKNRTRFPLGL